MIDSGRNDTVSEMAGLSGNDRPGGVSVGLPGGAPVGAAKTAEEYTGLFKLPDPDTAESEPALKAPVCSLKPGDSIRIRASGKIGIVYAPIDEKGNVGVQVQDRKLLINHKRIRLLTPAEELYPDYPKYDLSIVLDTVANRKARHRMGKGHFEGNEIIIEKERQP
jgi:hypothetical protein